MNSRAVSATMEKLLEYSRDLHRRARQVDAEVERAYLAETAAVCAYKEARCRAIITTPGTGMMKEAHADLDTIELFKKAEIATGLRRSAVEAAKTLHHQLDEAAALCNAYNRELKTELALAGAAR